MIKSLIQFLVALLAFLLISCTADYDTFGTSDYKNFSEISFAEQDGNAAMYSGEHKVKVKLVAPDEDESYDSVTIENFKISSLASLHLVNGKFKEFPSDSAALDSLANEVSYVKDALHKGEKIRIPSSLIVYLMVVSESGSPAIWQLNFTIPGVEPASSSSVAESSKSSDSKSSDSKSSNSRSESTSSSSAAKDDDPSEQPSGDPAKAPRIESIEIAGHKAILDSVEDGDGFAYHFHVDNLDFMTDLTSLEVTTLEVSEGGECSIEKGSSYDFSDNMSVSVTNADGDKRVYTVKAGYQIPGSDFDVWNSNDPTPDSLWNNANTILTTTTKYSSGSVVGAKIKTGDALGKIASGSLYTAEFNPNGVGTLAMASSSTWPDGNELLDFGKPFKARPEYIEVDFSYDGGGDSCDIYILLENRAGNMNRNRSSSDVNKLVASAWYRSTTDDNSDRENPDVVAIYKNENEMHTVRMKLTYGVPKSGSAIENSSTFNTTLQSTDKKAINNGLEKGKGDETVTHVRVVFASSADGNHYNGKSGATLIIDEMRLIY